MERPPLLAVIFGTGFGSGFWPWGPGTAGAFLATFLWLAMAVTLHPTTLFFITFALIVVFTAVGTWAANRLEPFWGEDPKRVVIDEMIGMWMPLLAVSVHNGWYVAASFVLFRFFDILKPLGIRTLDRRHGGFWVMADDLLAGVYSLIIILVTQWAI